MDIVDKDNDYELVSNDISLTSLIPLTQPTKLTSTESLWLKKPTIPRTVKPQQSTSTLALLPPELLDVIASNLCNKDLMSLLIAMSYNKQLYSKVYIIDTLLIKTGIEFIITLAFNNSRNGNKCKLAARNLLCRLGWNIRKIVTKTLTRITYDITLVQSVNTHNINNNTILQTLYNTQDYIYFQLEINRFSGKNRYRCSSNHFICNYTSSFDLISTVLRYKKQLQVGNGYVPTVVKNYFDNQHNLCITFVNQTYVDIIPISMTGTFDTGCISLRCSLIDPLNTNLKNIACSKQVSCVLPSIFISCLSTYKQYSHNGNIVRESKHLQPVGINTDITNFQHALLHEVIHIEYRYQSPPEFIICRRCYFLTSSTVQGKLLLLPLMYWNSKWRYPYTGYDNYLIFDGSTLTSQRLNINDRHVVFNLFYDDEEDNLAYTGPTIITNNIIPESTFIDRFA